MCILYCKSSQIFENFDLKKSEAFNIYNFITSNLDFKRNEIFLLESLGPNPIDSKESILGINPLLTIEVNNNIVKLSGLDLLLRDLYKNLSKNYKQISYDVTLNIVLNKRNDIWNFFRTLENNFSLVGDHNNRGAIFFGYFGYETIHYVENLGHYQDENSDLPVISLSLYEHILALTDENVKLTSYSLKQDNNSHQILLDHLNGFKSISSSDLKKTCEKLSFQVEFETQKEAYLGKSEKALEHIRIGDIYQVQIGQKLIIKTEIDALNVYENLRIQNPSPYMYLFNVKDFTVVGASPELFLKIDGNRVLMRPIAGTVGKFNVSDRLEAINHLHNDEKEVAEHLMLVDLCRNDLHRICKAESVNISDLMAIEEYSHVYHMVTTTHGELESYHDKFEVIKAAFPAGTMTGTPKIRAIELIDLIEDSRRGVYAGAIGLLGFGTNFVNTALCIRTAVKRENSYILRASAGMVSDSKPVNEYQETLYKLGSMFKAITGEELSCQLG